MKSSEIIIADAQRNGLNPKSVLNGVASMIKSKEAAILKTDGSVLIVKAIGKGIVELHLFTVEQPIKLVRSLKKFIEEIKKSKIKIVYGNAENEMILRLLMSIGVKVTNSDLPKYNWQAYVLE